ncbi:MAG: exodeoxyribonuclease VII large subunit [Fluviicola sp.]
MDSPQHFTLKQVAESIRKTIAERYSRTYWVTAEMHKLNATRKGHCYPELVQKEDGQIVVEMRGTIWKQQFERIQKRFAEVVKEPLRDGLELLFLVKITYHPLYNIGLEIIDIDPNYTLGALHRERQETLDRLNKEGLLNANQQLEMALLPKRLAIISQADSKGYSDFVTLLNGHPKRYHFDTFLFEATLQGDAAIQSISAQLERIRKVKHHFDAVVIIRGGGGEIGMHCYNNYELAKAISTFPLPVLTGIGHSTNLTVCEMIAYRNGITPSDMAYFLIGILEELDQEIDALRTKTIPIVQRFLREAHFIQDRSSSQFHLVAGQRLQLEKRLFSESTQTFDRSIRYALRHFNDALQQKRNDLRFTSQRPLNDATNTLQKHLDRMAHGSESILRQGKQLLSENKQRILWSVPNQFIEQVRHVERMAQFIELVDPAHVLNRGYSIVRNDQGVLSTSNLAKKGDVLHVQTAHQHLTTRVENEEKT